MLKSIVALVFTGTAIAAAVAATSWYHHPYALMSCQQPIRDGQTVLGDQRGPRKAGKSEPCLARHVDFPTDSKYAMTRFSY